MKLNLLLTAAIAMYASAAISAVPGPGCSAKQAKIEAQISNAKARDQKHKLNGLNNALQATMANCTEDGLLAERNADIGKARQKLAERESELRQAEKDGDAKKVKKSQAKAEEARSELAALEAE